MEQNWESARSEEPPGTVGLRQPLREKLVPAGAPEERASLPSIDFVPAMSQRVMGPATAIIGGKRI